MRLVSSMKINLEISGLEEVAEQVAMMAGLLGIM
jgi:hypothetical protein